MLRHPAKSHFQAVVRDTGYVCSAKVIDGIDKKSDTDAEKAVQQWHFVPAKKDGRPVPVVVIVKVKYERDMDGNIVLTKLAKANADWRCSHPVSPLVADNALS